MNTPDTEWIDIAIANLIFSGLSIAQMDKLPKWLLENMEENKTKFKETIISSRDTYWKERVRSIQKLYEDQCVEEIGFVVKGDKVWEALDNLK